MQRSLCIRDAFLPIVLLATLSLGAAGSAKGEAVLEYLPELPDWESVDMSTVQPARVRIGPRALEKHQRQSAPDPTPVKKLEGKSTRTLEPRFIPGYSGQARPAGMKPIMMKSSTPRVAASPRAVDQPRDWEVLHDESISSSAYNALGSFPFNASRVNIYDDIVTNRYPYRTIGLLLIFIGEDVFGCTASLVGPGLGVTAAHCVREFGGDLVDGLVFLPGYHRGVAPFGAWGVTRVATTEAWRDGTSNCTSGDGVGCEDDVALLGLETRTDSRGREFTLGERIGWLTAGVDLYGFDTFFDEPVGQFSQFGYPGSHDQADAMQRADKSATYDEDDNIVYSSSPFGPGISGGPYIANFGEAAEVESDFDFGFDADPNIVSVITIAGNELFADDLGAALNDDNFVDSANRICNGNPILCDTDFADVIASRDMLLNIEEPANGGTYSGVGNLRGWAVYELGIESIEVYIDGEFQFLAPYGGERNDVGNSYPDIPDSNFSGFSLAFGYLNLEPGEHELEIFARSGANDFTSRRSTFTVTKFDTAFVAADDEVDVDNADVTLNGDSVALDGVVIDGETYDIELQWDTASQGFNLRAIEKTGE